jgi:hypothetical protein
LPRFLSSALFGLELEISCDVGVYFVALGKIMRCRDTPRGLSSVPPPRLLPQSQTTY